MPDKNAEFRRPKKKDFEGKTIKTFLKIADNMWNFHFTDGSSISIQCEMFYPGVVCMGINGRDANG